MSSGSFNFRKRELINWGEKYFKVMLFKIFSNGKTVFLKIRYYNITNRMRVRRICAKR